MIDEESEKVKQVKELLGLSQNASKESMSPRHRKIIEEVKKS